MATFAARMAQVDYINWLKVGLGLNYLKEGLDNVVDTECKALHKDILLSAFGSDLKTKSACEDCVLRDIKEDRKNQTWKIKCWNHVCDEILEKILEWHVSGKNIPWSNSGAIKDWMDNPWAVAKLFMNPGQTYNKKLQDFDCSNIMNLFINCKWFYSKFLKNIGILANNVREHRNKLMHSTTMKVSNDDMKSWLSDMITVLRSISDFNNRPDAKRAVGRISKLRDTALKLTAEDEVKTMRLYFKAVRSQAEQARSIVEDIGTKSHQMSLDMDTIKSKMNIDMTGFTTELSQFKEDLKMKSTTIEEFKNELDAHAGDTAKLDKHIQNIQLILNQDCALKKEVDRDIMDVKTEVSTLSDHLDDEVKKEVSRCSSLEKKLLDIEAKLDARVLSLKLQMQENKKAVEIAMDSTQQNNKEIEQAKKDLTEAVQNTTDLKQRVMNVEDQQKIVGIIKNDSYRLRKLKEETSSFLESVVGINFIRTKQFQLAVDKVKEKRHVLISGKPGEGKTTSAAVIMCELFKSEKCIKINTPFDWEIVLESEFDVVFIDDVFGRYKLDTSMLKDWLRVMSRLDHTNMNVIVCSRSNIIAECDSELKDYILFKYKVDFSSDNLDIVEKRDILCTKLVNAKKQLTEEEISQCLQEFTCPIGFPYCCHLFTEDPSLFNQKAKFFEKPYQFFLNNIKNMDKSKMLAFICIFHKEGKLSKAAFTCDEDRQDLKKLVSKIADMLGGIEREPATGTLRKCIRDNVHVYTEDWPHFYSFAHNVIYETIGLIYGKENPSDVIMTCSLDFLCQCVDTDTSSSSEDVLHVEPAQYEDLATRIINEVIYRGEVFRIASHPAFLCASFIDTLFQVLSSRDLTEDFLLQNDKSDLGNAGQSLDLEFYILTGVLLLRNMSNECAVFAFKCFEKLQCGHAHEKSCRKCYVKQKAFHLSFLNIDTTLPLKLMDDYSALQSTESLFVAVDSKRDDLVEAFIERMVQNGSSVKNSGSYISPDDDDIIPSKRLKTDDHFHPDASVLHETLESAINQEMAKLTLSLIEAGIKPRVCCLNLAFTCKNRDTLNSILQSIMDERKPIEHTEIHSLFQEPSRVDKRTIQYVSETNFVFQSCCLELAIQFACSSSLNSKVVQEIAMSRTWDIENKTVHKLLHLAIEHNKEDISEILNEASFHPEPCCLLKLMELRKTNVKNVLFTLIKAGQWDAQNEDVHKIGHHIIKSGTIEISEACLQIELTSRACIVKYAFGKGKHSLASVLIEGLKKADWVECSDGSYLTRRRGQQIMVSKIISKFPPIVCCFRQAVKANNQVEINDMEKWATEKLNKSKMVLTDGSTLECDLKKTTFSKCCCFGAAEVQELALLPASVQRVRSTFFGSVEENFMDSFNSFVGLTNMMDKTISPYEEVTIWCLNCAIFKTSEKKVKQLIQELLKNKEMEDAKDVIHSGVHSAIRHSKLSILDILTKSHFSYCHCCTQFAFETNNENTVLHVLKLQQESGFDHLSMDLDTEGIIKTFLSNRTTAKETEIILRSLFPPRPWFLTYADKNNVRLITEMVQLLQSNSRQKSDSTEFHRVLDNFLLDASEEVIGVVLELILQPGLWAVKHAVKCDLSLLNRILKTLQENREIDLDIGRGEQELKSILMRVNGEVAGSILMSINGPKLWLLKFAVKCNKDIAAHITQRLQELGQLQLDYAVVSQELQSVLFGEDENENINTEILEEILRTIHPPRMWFLKCAIRCNEKLVKDIMKMLSDSGRMEKDDSTFNDVFEFSADISPEMAETLLKAVTYPKPWLLKYAIKCSSSELVLDIMYKFTRCEPIQHISDFDLRQVLESSNSNMKECILKTLPFLPCWVLSYAKDCNIGLVVDLLHKLQSYEHKHINSDELHCELTPILTACNKGEKELIIREIKFPQPWLLNYAVGCDANLVLDLLQNLRNILSGMEHYDLEKELGDCLSNCDIEFKEMVITNVSPPQPWFLKHAVECQETILSKIIQELYASGTGQLVNMVDTLGEFTAVVSEMEEFQQIKILDTCFSVCSKEMQEVVLQSTSPGRFRLKYAKKCGAMDFIDTLQELREAFDDFDFNVEDLDDLLSGCNTEMKELVLKSIKPPPPFFLKHAVTCSKECVTHLMKELNTNPESMQYFIDDEELDFLSDCNTENKELVLKSIKPPQPFFLKHAVTCSKECVTHFIKELNTDPESMQGFIFDNELDFLSVCNTEMKELVLKSIKPPQPFFLKHAVTCSKECVTHFIKELNTDPESMQGFIFDNELDFLSVCNTEMKELVLKSFKPPQPFFLKHAVTCSKECVTHFIKELNTDPESMQDFIFDNELDFLSVCNTEMKELVLKSFKPPQPFFLKHAVTCSKECVTHLIKEFEGTKTDFISVISDYSMELELDFLSDYDTEMRELVLTSIHPPQLFFLKFAVTCSQTFQADLLNKLKRELVKEDGAKLLNSLMFLRSCNTDIKEKVLSCITSLGPITVTDPVSCHHAVDEWPRLERPHWSCMTDVATVYKSFIDAVSKGNIEMREMVLKVTSYVLTPATFLSYAVECSEKFVTDSLESMPDLFDTVKKEESEELISTCLENGRSKIAEILLRAVLPSESWQLTYAAKCSENVLIDKIQNLKKPESSYDCFNMLRSMDTILGKNPEAIESVLRHIHSPKPWCIPYAAFCSETYFQDLFSDLGKAILQKDKTIEEQQNILRNILVSVKNEIHDISGHGTPHVLWFLKYIYQYSKHFTECVLHDLSQSGFFKDTEVLDILGDQVETIEIILQYITEPKSSFLKYAVNCSPSLLSVTIKRLRDTDQWKDDNQCDDNQCIHQTIAHVGGYELASKVRLLIEAGLKCKPCCLRSALHSADENIVLLTIQNLEEQGTCNITDEFPNCSALHTIFKETYGFAAADFILNNNPGFISCPSCLKNAMELFSRQSVEGRLSSFQCIKKILDSIKCPNLEIEDLNQAFSLVTTDISIQRLIYESDIKCQFVDYIVQTVGNITGSFITLQMIKNHFSGELEEFLEASINVNNTGAFTFLYEDIIIVKSRWLMKATERGNLSIVRQLISRLPNTNSQDMHQFLEISIERKYLDLIQFYLELDIELRPCCVESAIKMGEKVVVNQITQKLIASNILDENDEVIHNALEISLKQSQNDMVSAMISGGIVPRPCCFKSSMRNCSLSVSVLLIESLICLGHWDGDDSDIHEELHNIICKRFEMTHVKKLVEAGLQVKQCCLIYATTCVDSKQLVPFIIGEVQSSRNEKIQHNILHDAFENALKNGNHGAIEALIDAELELEICCLQSAALSGDRQAVMKVLETYHWAKCHKDIHNILRLSCDKDHLDIAKAILKSLDDKYVCCFRYAVRTRDKSLVEAFIQRLKSTQQWCPDNKQLLHALEVCCSSGSPRILNLLLVHNLQVQPRCLFYAVHSGNGRIVRRVVENLIQTDKLSRNHEALHEAFEVAASEKHYFLFTIFLRTLSQIQPCCLQYAVETKKCTIVSNFIIRLKELKQWDLHNEKIHQSLEVAIEKQMEGIKNVLFHAELTPLPCCLKPSVMSGCTTTIQTIIQKLKNANMWTTVNPVLHDALHICLCRGNRKVLNALTENGLSLSHCCIPEAVVSGQSDMVEEVFQQVDNAELNELDLHSSLETAIGMGNMDIVEILKTNRANLRPCCLKHVVKSSNLSLLTDIISQMKEKNADKKISDAKSNCDKEILAKSVHVDKIHSEFHLALRLAYENGQIDMAEKIIRSLDYVQPCCLRHVVRTGKTELVHDVIADMKNEKRWNTDDPDIHEALEIAVTEDFMNVVQIFKENEVTLKGCCLLSAVFSNEESVIDFVIESLKDSGLWNKNHEDIHEAIKLSSSKRYVNITDHILNAVESPMACCLDCKNVPVYVMDPSTAQESVMIVDDQV